jgi:hypothetical protein
MCPPFTTSTLVQSRKVLKQKSKPSRPTACARRPRSTNVAAPFIAVPDSNPETCAMTETGTRRYRKCFKVTQNRKSRKLTQRPATPATTPLSAPVARQASEPYQSQHTEWKNETTRLHCGHRQSSLSQFGAFLLRYKRGPGSSFVRCRFHRRVHLKCSLELTDLS